MLLKIIYGKNLIYHLKSDFKSATGLIALNKTISASSISIELKISFDHNCLH